MTSATLSANMLCDDAAIERPRYFPRQLVTADDLMLEQEYFRNKLRRHNRLLHGWGVVYGAKVCPIAKKSTGSGTETQMELWKVKVERGYLLGPYGDEIFIDCERIVDLRTFGVSAITGEPFVESPGPSCSEVLAQRERQGKLFVAVKYREFSTISVNLPACEMDTILGF
jgi:hypothetical protein